MISNNIKFLVALLVLVGAGSWWYMMPASVDVVKDSVTNTLSNVTGAVKTTETAPTVTKPATVVPKPASATRLLENGRYISVVNLTSKGFDPAVVALNRGEEIRFINQSNLTMRIVFTKNGVPNDIPGLNQETSLGKGGKYQVLLNDAGVWAFFNLNGDKTKIGVMTVQ